MRRCAYVLAIVLAVPFLSQVGIAQTKRPITDKDLFRFQWIGDPQVSPDGTRVVFVRVTVNEKKDNYDTALWMPRYSADVMIVFKILKTCEAAW